MSGQSVNLSELPYSEQWKIVGYVQIAWFAIVLAAAIASYFKSFSIVKNHFKGFAVSFTIFSTFKLVGGITSTILFKGSTFNSGVYIATYIFDSISLGALLRSLFPFIQVMLDNGFENQTPPSYVDKDGLLSGTVNNVNQRGGLISGLLTKTDKNGKPQNPVFRVLFLVVLAAIIISIIGSSKISFTTPSSEANSLLRVSSILFIAAIVLLSILLGYIFFTRTEYARFAAIIALAIPFVFIRCLYSVLSSFHGVSYTSPYLLVFGDYKYYAFMALMCEGIASIIYLLSLNIFINHYKSLGL
ncbi:hypothetical protein DFJ63DRAFT_337008 [Scheffersomyces coipomensis]|uniref:uncharacterized protein n=1 Tax=Scheffersomyces coipomensis TaxID=1788519 RepID=UPI00315C6A5A